MKWAVLFDDEFEVEFHAMPDELQNELLAHAILLQDFGPNLGRPAVDTLKGSKHTNMKELRFAWCGGVWRVAFIFDPLRQAILLTAGDKAGVNQKRFYRKLISLADNRYDNYLHSIKTENGVCCGKKT